MFFNWKSADENSNMGQEGEDQKIFLHFELQSADKQKVIMSLGPEKDLK